MTRDQRVRELAKQIRVGARVAELKHLAAETSKDYERALAASGMTREHFNLRLMLLGRLLLPPPRKGE